MKVLLTGACGYVGAATLEALVAAGHDVIGITRSEEKAESIRQRGAVARVGDVRDNAFLAAIAATVDGAIHLASPGDETSAQTEEIVVAAILEGLGKANKPFVSTAGLWDHGSGDAISETTTFRAPQITAWRPAMTRRVLGGDGVRSSVISPALVYGRGDSLLHLVANGPRVGEEQQSLLVVGGGQHHWGNVHVDDLAELYVLALEKAPAGTYLIGANLHAPTAREIASAASTSIGLHGRVEPEGVAATVKRLGVLAEALLLDQQVVSTGAERLGWRPAQLSIIEHLAQTTNFTR